MLESAIRDDYWVAAFLADPARGARRLAGVDWEYLDADALLKVVRRNKIPLATVGEDAWCELLKVLPSPELESERKEEALVFSEQRREWGRIRGEFLAAGIESMLIKSTGLFPYKSSNLDVLIREEKRPVAEAILRGMGYIQLHNVEEPYKTLFRSFSEGNPASVIHLHNKVAWINPFHDEELLWSRYRRSDEDEVVDIPSPEDSILILTAHWFYEDKEIKVCDVMNISRCLRHPGLDWGYIEEVAERLGWSYGLHMGLLVYAAVEASLYGESVIPERVLAGMKAALPGWMRGYLERRLQEAETRLPLKLSKVFGKTLHLVKTVRDRTTGGARKVRELYMVIHAAVVVVLFERAGINIRHQVPMLISFSGVDGSGKSLYAEHLLEILGVCELRKALVWSRIGSSSFLKPFAELSKLFYRLRRRTSGVPSFGAVAEDEERRKYVFSTSRLASSIGLSLLLLEMAWLYRVRVALPLLFGKVVVCDRYVYDTLVDVEVRYGIPLTSTKGKTIGRILDLLAPKGGIAYVFEISQEEACTRKGVRREEAAWVGEQVKAYGRIAASFPCYRIETEREEAKASTCNRIIHETLGEYYEKWR